MPKEIALNLKRRILVACAQAGCIGRTRAVADAARRRSVRRIDISCVLSRGICQLLIDIGIDADALHMSDIAGGDSEGCLVEKSSRIRGSNKRSRCGWWCRRRSGGWRRGTRGIAARSTACCQREQHAQRIHSGRGCAKARAIHYSTPWHYSHTSQRAVTVSVDA
jgi:hypothetical protein